MLSAATGTAFSLERADATQVVIERATRNKRKCVTSVQGLELFEVKLVEASKKFGKKFACGASVVKDAGNTKELIDVQARRGLGCSAAADGSFAGGFHG